MSVTSLHRPPTGDPDAVRVVTDGFRLSAFLFTPVALLAARLWLAFGVWLVLVVAAVALVAMGTLSPGAAVVAIALLHLGFALDLGAGERRRLQRRGWTMVALTGPWRFHDAEPRETGSEPMDPALARSGMAAPPARPDVLGLFPDRS